MQRSAAARMRCFSAPENRRYLATATTSGLGGVASAAPFALRALGTAEAESKLSVMEVFINGVMSRSCLCTLNCPRQVSHLILARGAQRKHEASYHDRRCVPCADCQFAITALSP